MIFMDNIGSNSCNITVAIAIVVAATTIGICQTQIGSGGGGTSRTAATSCCFITITSSIGAGRCCQNMPGLSLGGG